MVDDIGLFVKYSLQHDLVRHASFDEQDIWKRRDVPLVGRGQVVQDDHSPGVQFSDGSDKVRAYGAGPARNQHNFIFVMTLVVLHGPFYSLSLLSVTIWLIRFE